MAPSDIVYRRSADIVFRRILDEHILVPVRGELADMQKVFALNPVAAAIWEALEEPRAIAELTAAVVRAFAVEEVTAGADVARFLDELKQAGLVESTGSA